MRHSSGTSRGYYACLLPFFFLTGVFVSLSFVLNPARIGRVYGFDLTGAGAGALLVLALMELVHPFFLVPCLLVAPRARRAVRAPHRRCWPRCWRSPRARRCCSATTRPRSTTSRRSTRRCTCPNAKVLAEIRSPRGLYMLLDDFTERVDTDVSNDAGMLGLPGPPTTFGLYRDGNRIASLPKPGGATAAYAAATLAALPYQLLPHPHVLLVGASGGFRIAEARALGAAKRAGAGAGTHSPRRPARRAGRLANIRRPTRRCASRAKARSPRSARDKNTT